MKKLIILDYTANTVDVYNVDSNVEVTEEYLKKNNLINNNCSWMVGDFNIVFHKGGL